jgi:hypothetical protein
MTESHESDSSFVDDCIEELHHHLGRSLVKPRIECAISHIDKSVLRASPKVCSHEETVAADESHREMWTCSSGGLESTVFGAKQEQSSLLSNFLISSSELEDSCSSSSDDAITTDEEDDDDDDIWGSSGFSSPSSSSMTADSVEVPAAELSGRRSGSLQTAESLLHVHFGGLFMPELSSPHPMWLLTSPLTAVALDVDSCVADDSRTDTSSFGAFGSSPVSPRCTASSRIERLNSEWNEFYETSVDTMEESSLSGQRRVVQFCTQTSVVTVPNQLEWADAYEEARRGPWEEYARDRDRFQHRIKAAADVIGWVLGAEHRARKFSSLCCCTTDTSIDCNVSMSS